MKVVGPVFRLTLLLALALMPSLASPQVPPHRPGTICFTPYFWCWVPPPGGQPGAPCACFTPNGPVHGQLG
jgi:hypothetical protein